MKAFSTEIALVCAIFFCFMPLAAQDVDSAVEQMAEEGAAAEDVEDYLQQLHGRRLDLNAARRGELEACGLLTPFQIASLLDYRKEYGRILSLQELSMIDGFTPEFAQKLSPFITLGGDFGAAAHRLQLRSRLKYRQGQEGVCQYNRALYEGGRWQAGLLTESDAGEKPLADYIGAYLGYQKGRAAVLLGDYSACFGQGLALWSAYCFTSSAAPEALMRRPKGISPYKSCDETRALRGVAFSWGASRGIGASAFASVRGVDANVTGAGYTSVQTTGYHRSLYERACKNAMREYLFGVNLGYGWESVRLGVTAVGYSYSEHNARKVFDYNRYQLYDGWQGNLSADFAAAAGHWRIFSEAALDFGGHPAAIAGAVFTPSYDFELSFAARYYSKEYIAARAGAYSTITSVSNQQALVLCLLLRPLKGLQLTSFSEAVHYPWMRYRIGGPSSAFYQKLRAGYAAGFWSVSAQDHFVYQTFDGSRRHSLKAAAKFGGRRWKAALRTGGVILCSGQDSSQGWAASAELTGGFFQGRLTATGGLSYYHTDNYDTRVYLYGSDLPASMTFLYYYGKGIAAKGLVKLKIGRKCTVSSLVALSPEFECRLQADFIF